MQFLSLNLMDEFVKFGGVIRIEFFIRIGDIITSFYLAVEDGKRLLKRVDHIIGILAGIGAARDEYADLLRFFYRRIGTAAEARRIVALKTVNYCFERSWEKIIIYRGKKDDIVRLLEILKEDVEVLIRAAIVQFAVTARRTRRRCQFIDIVLLDFTIGKGGLYLPDYLCADALFTRRRIYY